MRTVPSVKVDRTHLVLFSGKLALQRATDLASRREIVRKIKGDVDVVVRKEFLHLEPVTTAGDGKSDSSVDAVVVVVIIVTAVVVAVITITAFVAVIAVVDQLRLRLEFVGEFID